MRALVITLAALVGAACDSPGNDRAGVTGNLGVAGASCLSSLECEAPLQCLRNVCGGSTASEADVVGGDATSATDAAIPDTAAPDTAGDLEVVTDILTEYDASDWEFQAADTSEPEDTTPVTDINNFQDCGPLGVASAWSGTFAGNITFSLTAPPGLGIPTSGIMPVAGTLTFEITCVESKFVVRGALDGLAHVEGQGDFPFNLSLAGVYDPAERRLTARMIDGVVNIYGLILVYFEGTFGGEIQLGGDFAGDWTGYSTGTNQQIVTGSASGNGGWNAHP